MCGENRRITACGERRSGSSPRVRGKLWLVPKIAVLPGLIPACAGKTRVNDHGCPCAGAHPRVCGENAGLGSFAFAFVGSSPRVRGKHMNRLTDVQDARLIPACAGKTCSVRRSASQWWAHPRVCGENRINLNNARGIPGSSPRVRGKLPKPTGNATITGLIPACAGKTWHKASSAPCRGAHPRVCGENATNAGKPVGAGGSSPRVRGKHRNKACERARGGLIPACAGKTPVSPGIKPSHRAHPRVCGENMKISFGVQALKGSSPRVRGKLVQKSR